MLRATTAGNFSSLSWLRTGRFSKPTFRPSGATNHWKKHSVSRLSYLFARVHLLSSYSFSSTLLSSNLSLLSASSLLCFSSVHIVGSLTSKLASIKYKIFGLRMWIRDAHWDIQVIGSYPINLGMLLVSLPPPPMTNFEGV